MHTVTKSWTDPRDALEILRAISECFGEPFFGIATSAEAELAKAHAGLDAEDGDYEDLKTGIAKVGDEVVAIKAALTDDFGLEGLYPSLKSGLRQPTDPSTIDAIGQQIDSIARLTKGALTQLKRLDVPNGNVKSAVDNALTTLDLLKVRIQLANRCFLGQPKAIRVVLSPRNPNRGKPRRRGNSQEES